MPSLHLRPLVPLIWVVQAHRLLLYRHLIHIHSNLCSKSTPKLTQPIQQGLLQKRRITVHSHLFTYLFVPFSFMYYGQEQAQYKTQRLVPQIDSAILYPCYNRGYNKTASFDQSTVIVGTGKIEECVALIRQHLNMSSCTTLDCTIGSNYLAPIPDGMPLFAMGAFASASSFFNMSSFVTVNLLKPVVERLCAMSWDEVTHNIPRSDYQATGCFLGNYMIELV